MDNSSFFGERKSIKEMKLVIQEKDEQECYDDQQLCAEIIDEYEKNIPNESELEDVYVSQSDSLDLDQSDMYSNPVRLQI